MRYQIYILCALSIALCISCEATKHLQPGQYLIKSDARFRRTETVAEADTTKSGVRLGFVTWDILGKSTLDASFLSTSVKTVPNKRMLFVKTYLHLYNLGKTLQKYEYPLERYYKKLFPDGKLFDRVADFLVNTAGEKPILLDSAMLDRDVKNLETVYFSKGYFNPRIAYETPELKGPFGKKKVNVTFLIDEGFAYMIDSVEARVQDHGMRNVLKATQKYSLLQKGELFNEDNLANERLRLTTSMRNAGYFTFSPSMVTYTVDTIDRGTMVLPKDLSILKVHPVAIRINIEGKPHRFQVGEIRFLLKPSWSGTDSTEDFINRIRAEDLNEEQRRDMGLTHRILSDDIPITFLCYRHTYEDINLNILSYQVAFEEGKLIQIRNEKETQRKLQELGIFQFVTIKYEVNESDSTVDVIIEGKLAKKYQLKAGLEGFSQNSRNDALQQNLLPGAGGNLLFRDKKLFKGAEKFELSSFANISFYFPGEQTSIQTYFETGASGSLYFPRFLFPNIDNRRFSNFVPNTVFTASFNSQRRVEYDRTTFGVNWTYKWYHHPVDRKNHSSFTPLLIKFIQSDTTPEFSNTILGIPNESLRQLILLDFEPRFSSAMVYKFTHSTYGSKRNNVTWLLEPAGSIGGNIPYLIDRYFPVAGDTSFRDAKIRNLAYGQYLKLTAEFKMRIPVGRGEIVLRSYSGISQPWNHTTQVPFDARFFSGGTNSMRGWQSNTLGPGVFKRGSAIGSDDHLSFLVSPGGELIFETNAEIRIPLFSYFQAALFSDLGNVWYLPWSSFSSELGKLSTFTLKPGWDAGMGIRLDFSYFVFRADIAHQVYAPDKPGFVSKFFSEDIDGLPVRRIQFNFGIGYPF